MRVGEMSGKNIERGTRHALRWPFLSMRKACPLSATRSRISPGRVRSSVIGSKRKSTESGRIVLNPWSRPLAAVLEKDVVFVEPHGYLIQHVLHVVPAGIPHVRMHVANVSGGVPVLPVLQDGLGDEDLRHFV